MFLKFIFILVSIAKLTICLEVEETIPLSNEKILMLIDSFKVVSFNDTICFRSEACAKDWIEKYNKLYQILITKSAYLDYTFNTNITEVNEKSLADFNPILNKFSRLTKPTACQFYNMSKSFYSDQTLKRMLFLACDTIIYNSTDVQKLTYLQTKLESIYAKAVVCEGNVTNAIKKDCLSLDPDLSKIMKGSRDYDKLLWAWKGWHDASGGKMRSIFAKTVRIKNKAARENNYRDLSEVWVKKFDVENFEKDCDLLFESIQPLYKQLHTYVRRKLNKFYNLKSDSYIQAHLLGNMWAQNWDNIFDIVKPYPNVTNIDIKNILLKYKFTPMKMFQQAEDFFVSLGLSKMTPAFWKYSMLEKPKNRSAQCHASAFDMANGYDFRIKMCTSVDEDNFYTIHHEMGHIEYYMYYKDQPFLFQDGANSAFHEAVGDTIALSVMTSTHFKRINLIEDDMNSSYEQEINGLMDMALKKLAFIPFAYLMDKWRWDVFRGKINETNYNEVWWKLRKTFQGLVPPVERDERYFDPGAKFHIASYTPYSRYFIGSFLQFQFYKSLCTLADHQGDLHKCDFYNSKAAGDGLRKMLQQGSSKHWSFVLQSLTNETKVSSNAIIEYFKPLSDWLVKENLKYSSE